MLLDHCVSIPMGSILRHFGGLLGFFLGRPSAAAFVALFVFPFLGSL